MRRLPALMLALFLCAVGPGQGETFACSSHGTIGGQPVTLRADLFGDLDGDGLINGRLGIVDGFIAPTTSSNCVAGVGLGNFSITAPARLQVEGARIAIVHQPTGASTPLRSFSFAANSVTTSALERGGNGIEPLFPDSTWFGFSSVVDPFTLPALGTDEAFELQFDIELPPSDLPLSIPVQFAAGEGDTSGTPIFTGGHPVGYFTAVESTAQFTSVPEPASQITWLAGVFVVGWYAWRNRKR